MLRIRLARRGKKRQPSYRIVVAEIESPRDGRYVEQIGHFNPMVNPEVFKLDEARALHWLSVGAQPTDAVNRLLVRQGTVDRLARMRAGESIEALASEVDGSTPPAAAPVAEAPAVVEEAAEAVVEETAEVVEEAAEEVVEAAEEVAEEAAEVEATDAVEATAEEAVAEAEEVVEAAEDAAESEEAA